MRAVIRRFSLFAVASLLSGASLVQAPAALAETPASCLTQLNTARAHTGLPAVARSATLSLAAQRHANYRAYADSHRLGDASAHYETSGRPYFTGRMPWDRTKRAGLRDGTWAKQGENVIAGSGGASALVGIRSWLAAPYHRFPMLDANMRSAGCGASNGPVSATHGAEVLEMVWPWGAHHQVLTGFPLPHATGVARSFDRRTETPSPFSSARTRVIGTVVSLQASGWHALRLTSRPTLARGSQAVSIYWSTPSGDRNLPSNAVMLAATGSLAAHTTYTVRMRGQVQGRPGGAWFAFARTWSFTTA